MKIWKTLGCQVTTISGSASYNARLARSSEQAVQFSAAFWNQGCAASTLPAEVQVQLHSKSRPHRSGEIPGRGSNKSATTPG